MDGTNVYEFVCDYLEQFFESEEYARLLICGEDDIKIKVEDEELVNKGLLGFHIEGAVSDGWHGLTIEVNTDYYLTSLNNNTTIYLDYARIIIKSKGKKYNIENDYTFMYQMLPWDSNVTFVDCVLHIEKYTSYFPVEFKDCKVYIDYIEETLNLRCIAFCKRTNSIQIDNLIYKIGESSNSSNDYYSIYMLLKLNKGIVKNVVLKQSFKHITYSTWSDMQIVIKYRLTGLVNQVIFKAYISNNISSIYLNNIKSYLEDFKKLDFISDYQIIRMEN